MSETSGSFFVVKRKADEEEIFGGKRLRLLGSYTSKPNEDDIVSHVGRKALGKKRVIIQDFDTHEFKQFISELPEKKTKTDDDIDYEGESHQQINQKSQNEHSTTKNNTSNLVPQGRLGLNLNAAENVTNTPQKVSNVNLTNIGEHEQETERDSNVDMNANYVYDVYGIDEDCLLDFGTINDPDEYQYDVDSDENDENWRGNDYPEDPDSDYEHESTTSNESYAQVHFCQDMNDHMELYDFELDEFKKFTLHDTDDEFGNGTDSSDEI